MAKSGTPSRKRVSSYDVAKRAGVSQTTVSVVMTDRRDIGIPEETRLRVRRAASELGYLPSRLTTGLLRGRSNTVGTVFISAPYSWNIFAGIQECLAAADFLPIVLTSNWKDPTIGNRDRTADAAPASDEIAIIRRLIEQHIDGILLYSVEPERILSCLPEFERWSLPVVLVDHPVPEADLDFVGSDEEAIGRLAARHLVEAGAASFGYLTLPYPYASLRNRGESYRSELRRTGHACVEIAMPPGGEASLRETLPCRLTPPAALFCGHDLLASAALDAATQLGWRVPGDLAIMGTGALDASRFARPALTTIDQRPRDIGCLACERLLERINGYTGPARTERIVPALIPRDSTRAILVEGRDTANF